MKKKIMCRPSTELDLEFGTGEILSMKFGIEALQHLSEVMDVNELKDNSNILESCACIVYSSTREYNSEMTLDKARYIVSEMSMETIIKIVTEFSDSIGDIGEELKKINSKNVMSQFQSMKMK